MLVLALRVLIIEKGELSMDKQARPVLASLSMGLVWILLLVNIVYDYIRDHLITPYSTYVICPGFGFHTGSSIAKATKLFH